MLTAARKKEPLQGENTERLRNRPIHYVLWESGPGGMEVYVTYYTIHFAESTEVFIYSLRPSPNLLNEDLDESHFSHGPRNNLGCYLGFFSYARKHRKNLFHLVNCGPVILLLSLLAGARRPIYHIHGTRYWKSRINKLILKTAWRIVSLFDVLYIANSNHSSQVFQKDVLKKKPIMIYNGFDVKTFLEKRTLRTRLRKMAYIGRLDKDKNVKVVIRLFEEIANSYPDLELHIAGALGIESEIRQQARESVYANRIHFHGWITNVSSFYASADLFVFPSAHESFGNVVAEALLTGLPVLTSNVPVFEEIFGGRRQFCLGDPADYESFRSNFLTAVADFPSLADMAYHAADDIAAKFNLEDHLQKITHAYHVTNTPNEKH